MRIKIVGFILLLLLVSSTFPVKDKQISTHVNFQPAEELPFFLRRPSDWAFKELNKLTLEQKIAQCFMVATWPNKGLNHQNEIDSLIKHYEIGGLIFFQGDRNNTKASISHYQSISKVPLLMGMDAEWGAAMRLWNEERFPFQLTMGAANSPKHTEVIAQAMARELKDLGIHLNFSPVLDVNTNPENPVIGFRSFGESPIVAGNLGSAMIRGMERHHILTCMKHFPGHGDTDVDSHYDLPTVNKSLMELEIVDWAPFKMGRLAGVSSLMMAHLNVPALDDSGTPTSLSKKVIQEYVRGKLKFNGLIISDALNMKAVADRYGEVEVVVKAFEAGNDILLYPSNIGASIKAIADKVRLGLISEEQVNESCLKVLTAKYHTMLKKQPELSVDPHQLEFAKMHIYERALTVLKNEEAIPVKDALQRIAVVTLGNDKEGFLDRLSSYHSDITHFHAYSGAEVMDHLLDSLKAFDVVMFNFHASSMLPKNEFNYPSGWKDLLQSLKEGPKYMVHFFGNPYGIKSAKDFEKVHSVVLGYENAFWAEERCAQLVFGAFQATTTLPVTLSTELPAGFAAETPKASRLKYTVPEELGVSRLKLSQIDSIALQGIKEGAYPGCQVVVAKDGKLFYQKSFGFQTYDSVLPVTDETVYDIASITKIVSSTLALMRMQDEGKLDMNVKLGDVLPKLTQSSLHKSIVLKDMMTHQAGLTPWIPFYMKTVKDTKPLSDFYSTQPNDSMNLRVANNLYMLNSYEDSMYHKILTTPLKPGKKYKYSDIGYYYVKKIVEETYSMSLDEFVTEYFYSPMGLRSLRYNPLDHYELTKIAPTEKDNYFRNQLVHGFVHDMGAAMTGGVGGHAGLFSNATDLAAFMQMYLNKGIYGGTNYVSSQVVKEYTSCQFCPTNRRGIGFDKPVRDLDGGPTCKLVSLDSYGHSGFTGTQVWNDPKYGVNYVFLSNRVYPSAENWKLVKMGIRTEIQRVIYEAIREAEK